MKLVLIIASVILGSIVSVAQTNRPLVGAIRWDAWTGGDITKQVERTLGPEKYHSRLPWFAQVIDDKTVRIAGYQQEVMDREIEFATAAGLDYWAFLIYQENHSMSVALKQYLKSPKRRQLGFCMILHNTLGAEASQWPRERDRAVAFLKEPGYQTVLDGRPLVYTFAGGNFPFDRFDDFLATARQNGLNPYCVYMGWNPAANFKEASKHGFDAVSAYAMGGHQPEFSDLARAVERDYWQNAAASKIPYVPLVTTGWDKRPRKDNPVSWEIGHDYHSQDIFPSRASPQEISAHLKKAISFSREHSEICQARTIIIYAWNEYDEGGWLAPTRGADGRPDTGRLDALRGILKKQEDTQQL